MPNYLKWFTRMIWVGVIINLTFAIPALVAPGFLNTAIGLPMQAFYPWMSNVGMLLIGVSLFYLPAGISPTRWYAYSWLCVISRLIAAVFWFWLYQSSEYPGAFLPLLVSDGTMFLVLTVLLQKGLPPEGKISRENLRQCLHVVQIYLADRWRSNSFRTTFGIVVVVIAFLGYQAWSNLLRVYPEPKFDSDEEHFKYGAIGLGITSRVPLYLFEALPKMFPEKLPGTNGWASLGFVFEPGKDLPIGLAKRHIGYPTVEPNCALCHTGAYQASDSELPVPIPTGPANTLDLQAFQWFLYDSAADPKFTVSHIMDTIEKDHELGFFEGLFYRFAIIPLAKMSLHQQGKKYAWQKLRPTQGRGRTDTFNPTKFTVFGFPDDSTIGTVDYPQIWNQKPREGMWLHWDGNNNAIKERNYAAAMAVGATPESVIVDSFKRVTDWLLEKPPAAYPFPIDQTKVQRGQTIWSQTCADCHEFNKVNTGQVTVDIETLGTDRYRLDSFTTGLVDKFHSFKKPPFDFGAYRKTQSYSNTPTDGIWARAPYLHNGSVPTLWDLLQAPEKRPKVFYKGYTVYDPVNLGFVSSGEAAEAQGFRFDVSELGNGNGGHLYGTDLSDSDKRDLIEFMKTL